MDILAIIINWTDTFTQEENNATFTTISFYDKSK